MGIRTTRVRRKTFSKIRFVVDDKYEHVRLLGSGTFGDVHEFRTQVGSEVVPVAVKRVKDIMENSAHLRHALRELSLMYHFRGHPNIVSLLDVDFIADKPYQGLYCYLELMDYDLATVIRHGTELLTEHHISSVGYQLFSALKYIHAAQVVHRDLKPGNILVSRNGTIKICDFGMARGILGDNYSRDLYTDYVTTRWYRAPEVLLTADSYHYGLDIWAGGCIVAELALRRPLFKGSSSAEQLLLIVEHIGTPPSAWWADRGRARRVWNKCVAAYPQWRPADAPHWPLAEVIPKGYPAELVHLLRRILVYRPAKRPSAAELLHDPFFAEAAAHDPELSPPPPLALDFETAPNDRLVHHFLDAIDAVRDGVRGRMPVEV